MSMAKVSAMPKPAMGDTAKPESPSLSSLLNDSVARKRAAFEQAKAKLADAITLEADANAQANVVSETQAEAINILTRGVILKDFSKDEVSAILGDAYGYAPKADGTPGKTPAGSGLTIRKRVVTIAEAFSVANGMIAEADYPRWMQGKSVEAIAPIVSQWEAGNLSPWQAYKDVTAREKQEVSPLPFNPEKLLKIAEALLDDEQRAKVMQSPALVAAYTAIVEAFTKPLPDADKPIDF